MIKAIIFDFDGVIVDTYNFNKNAVAAVFKKKRLKFDKKEYKEIFTGRSLKDSLKIVLAVARRESELEEFIKLKKEYDKFYSKETKAYEDTLKFITKIKDQFRIMVASGCRPIHLKLAFKKYGLNGVFEYLITSEDINHGKPDPEIYNLSLKKLKLNPNETIVIEDSPTGIKSAKNAGIKCIAITTTHSDKELKEADLIVDKLSDKKVTDFLSSN